MNCNDDNDEVVEELDVLLAKDLCQNLYALQYPITHVKRTFSADQRMVARVKPEHKKLELEVVLDTSSPNYDQSKGEQIALNVDGGATNEGMTYENSVMDTQILSSRCVSQVGRRFAAALIQNGQVHVTPISQIMQLQPSFKYMDRAEMRALQAAKMKAQAESGNSSQDEADDAKAVTVRFKGTETEASRAARERSYAAYEKRLIQEKWISTSVHHKDDAYASRERNRLLCSENAITDHLGNSSFSEMSLAGSDYLQTLIPQYVVSDIDSDITPDNVLSIANLKLLSLGEQLKLLMKNAKIMHFSHLLTLLPLNPDANSVVRSLQSFAVLVQGCWIVKSEVLFPPNTVSPIAGTPSDLMCKVRDYILCLFTKHDYLVRKDVAKQVNISSEEVKVILDEIAKMKIGSGWHLKLDRDTRFQVKFPEVHERQSMVWEARYKQLAKQLNIEVDRDAQMMKSPKQKTSSKSIKSPERKKTLKDHKSPPQIKRSKNKSAYSTSIENGISNDKFTESVVKIEQEVVMEPATAFQFTSETSSKSFTELLQEPISTPHLTMSTPPPFVIPHMGGKETAHENNTVEIPNNTFMLPMNFTHSVADQHDFIPSSVNMDSINSTVALVADQIQKQSNGTLTLNTDITMENVDTFYHEDVS